MKWAHLSQPLIAHLHGLAHNLLHGAQRRLVVHNAGRWCTTYVCTVEMVHNVASTNPDRQTTRKWYTSVYRAVAQVCSTGELNENAPVLTHLLRSKFYTQTFSLPWCSDIRGLRNRYATFWAIMSMSQLADPVRECWKRDRYCCRVYEKSPRLMWSLRSLTPGPPLYMWQVNLMLQSPRIQGDLISLSEVHWPKLRLPLTLSVNLQ